MHRFGAAASRILKLTAIEIVVLGSALAGCSQSRDSHDGQFSLGRSYQAQADRAATVPTRWASENKRVPYPYDEGVSLGSGWDSFSERKKHNSCITFSTAQDHYQVLDTRLHEVTDQDQVRALLDMTMKANATFPIKAVTVTADATSTYWAEIQTFRKDVIFIAKATVTNGAKYVVPPITKDGQTAGFYPASAVLLSDEAAQLAQRDRAAFREMCGDSFVSAQVTGAELSAVYEISTRKFDVVVKLSSFAKASASMGAFTAGGSTDFKTELEKHKQDIEWKLSFTQRGGSGQTNKFPAKFDDLQSILSSLPGGSKDEGGRPLFMILQSYDTLPNWPADQINPELTEAEKIKRYYQRLVSLYREMEYMQEEKRGLAAAIKPQYELELDRLMRDTNLNTLQDQLLEEIKRVSDLALTAQAPICSDVRLGLRLPYPAATAAELKDKCRKGRLSSADDYKWALRLPLPANAIPAGVLPVLVPGQTVHDAGKAGYAILLFQFWVMRPAVSRCRIQSECISNAELGKILDQLLDDIGVFRSNDQSVTPADKQAARKALLGKAPQMFNKLTELGFMRFYGGDNGN